MARLTRIYTKTGDDGTTGLGGGTRVGKDDPQVDAYGEVDEANSAIGMALTTGLLPEPATLLVRVQSELFNVGGELCLIGESWERTPLVQARHVEALEQACDHFNDSLAPLQNFILSGGTPQATALHLARTVCRRAERRVVALSHAKPVPPEVLQYLNRLSDLLFILARYENKQRGAADQLWDTQV
jgi:cob(I)alamin adenosyltransferase